MNQQYLLIFTTILVELFFLGALFVCIFAVRTLRKIRVARLVNQERGHLNEASLRAIVRVMDSPIEKLPTPQPQVVIALPNTYQPIHRLMEETVA